MGMGEIVRGVVVVLLSWFLAFTQTADLDGVTNATRYRAMLMCFWMFSIGTWLRWLGF